MSRSTGGLAGPWTVAVLVVAVTLGGAYGFWMAAANRPLPHIAESAPIAQSVVNDSPPRTARRRAPSVGAPKKAAPQPAPQPPAAAPAALPVRVAVTRNTDVYVVPRATQEPLAHIEAGVELPVLGAHEDWYLIQYESPRWGARRAYIQSGAVRPIP